MTTNKLEKEIVEDFYLDGGEGGGVFLIFGTLWVDLMHGYEIF